jgi:hypothetical protein
MADNFWEEIYFWREYGEVRGGDKSVLLQKTGFTPDKLEEELRKVKRIIIEAGKDLSESSWLEVALAAKRVFGPEAILDISIRKHLLGGAKVVWEGYILDNSILGKYERWRGV